MSDMKPPFGFSTALSEARDRLAGVAFEAIWERDLDTAALRWDETLESRFGYRRDEVASHLGWWRERVHPEDRARVEQTATDAIRGDAPGWSNEYRFRRKDGSWAWVASRCVIERDAEGRARRAVGAMIDISKLKEAESQLRQVLDTLPVGVAVVDRAGDVVLHNPASNRIWGGLIVPGQERYAKSEGFWHGTGKAIGPEEWASRRAIAAGEISRDELIDINTFDGQRRAIENYAGTPRTAARGHGVGRHRVPRRPSRRQPALDLRPRHGGPRRVRPAAPRVRHQCGHHRAQARRGGARSAHAAARGVVAAADRGAGSRAPRRRARAAR